MADFIEDGGTYEYDAEIIGTETTDWTKDGANKTLKFLTATGEADTKFVLPPSAEWLLIETYDIEGNEGWVGYTKWQSNVSQVDTDLSAIRSIVDAEYTLYKMKATLFDGTNGAKIYGANETTAFPSESSPTYTKTNYTPSTGSWVISDSLTAPDDVYAGDENDTDPFGDSSLILRHLFNDDATALVGNDASLEGSGSYTEAVLNEGYTISTPSLDNYMDLDATFPSGAFSVSYFAKIQTNTVHGNAQDDGNAVFGFGSSPANPHVYHHIETNGKIWTQLGGESGYSNSITYDTGSGAFPSDGEFHHVVVTYAGSGTISDTKMTVYIDGSAIVGGTSQGQGTYADQTHTDGRVGHLWWGHATYYVTFKGTIDQFDIYDKELTLSEVNEIGFV